MQSLTDLFQRLLVGFVTVATTFIFSVGVPPQSADELGSSPSSLLTTSKASNTPPHIKIVVPARKSRVSGTVRSAPRPTRIIVRTEQYATPIPRQIEYIYVTATPTKYIAPTPTQYIYPTATPYEYPTATPYMTPTPTVTPTPEVITYGLEECLDDAQYSYDSQMLYLTERGLVPGELATQVSVEYAAQQESCYEQYGTVQGASTSSFLYSIRWLVAAVAMGGAGFAGYRLLQRKSGKPKNKSRSPHRRSH